MPNALRLTDRPVVVQILLRFAVLCAVIAALVATQHVAVQRLSHRTADVAQLGELNHQVDELRYSSMLLSGWQAYAAWSISRDGFSQATDRNDSRVGFATTRAQTDKQFRALPLDELTPRETELYAKVKAAFAAYYAEDARVWALYEQKTAAAKRTADTTLSNSTAYLKIDTATAALQKSVLARSARTRTEATDQAAGSRHLALGMGAAALVIAALLGLFLARSITRPLRRVVAGADALAAGDVEHRVDLPARGDEIGRVAAAFTSVGDYVRDLAAGAERVAGGDLTVTVTPRSERDVLGRSFARMLDGMRTMVAGVTRSAAVVSGSSVEVARGAGEAGDAVSQIAVAMTELATGAERQVQLVGDATQRTDDAVAAAERSRRRAQDTVDAARAARASADSGARAIADASDTMRELGDGAAETVRTMRALEEKSEAIGGIVGSITAIAEQTNLLALNAAIEAARAGEQGRGFAVVAEEVRNLSEQAQAAARDVEQLLGAIRDDAAGAVGIADASAAHLTRGSETVDVARQAFDGIAAAIEEMNGRVEDIAAEIAEIAAAGERVRGSMGEIASVAEQSSAASEEVSASTEQTSASAQQIAASAHELAGTVQELEVAIGGFRLVAEG
jgi:methyl-accepting chemotaxis protein